MILQRLKSPSDRTNGLATLPDGREIKTLERPWLNNQVGISCIPAVEYFMMRDDHGKHRWWKILDVIGRTFIEWHEGYEPWHSEGCILSSKQDLLLMDGFFSERGVKYPITIRDFED